MAESDRRPEAMTTPQAPATHPPGAGRPQRLSIEISPRTLLTLLLLLAGLWALSRLLPVILVLVAALVIVGTVSPGVRWLEQRGIRRGLGIALIYIGLLGVALGFLTLTIPAFIDQAKALLEQEPALHLSLLKSSPS